MNLIIHRGTNEIGGTCIELESSSTRILLDFGIPLVTSTGNGFDMKVHIGKSTEELISQGVLPNIQGAYSDPVAIDGVIISHPHQDHYGLMQFINKNIPIWLGRATYKLLELNNIFLHQQNQINNPFFFDKSIPFRIGNFTITPYWNDHSAFDSYSFLIEVEGKRLFYSGDFRSHGRKSKVYQWFMHNKPSNVDYLLLEGTTIGRGSGKFKTEMDVEDELLKLFKQSQSVNYVYTSSQNLDRLVSIYRACVRSHKTLVVDVYTAYTLDQMSEFAGFPTPLKDYDNIQVLYSYWLTKGLFENGYKEIAYNFKEHKVSKDEISRNPNKYVLIVRPSMKTDLKKVDAENGNIIYSMWEGYKNQPQTKEFLDWLLQKKFIIHSIHTSGHADVETLKDYADAINPKFIIPIHTFNKSEYRNIFSQKIVELDDNETLSL